jgi:uncharacterized protein YndB with AHSA1/START domain
MSDPTVIHDTFTLERSYPVSAERVFAFLAEPDKKRRWYAADDNRASEAFEMDFREGGAERTTYRMGDQTPFPGEALTNEGRFEDIVPGRRVVISTSMTLAGRRISSSLVTFELVDNAGSTVLILTHQGAFYEGSGGPEMRKGGWESLLNRLDKAIGEPAMA